MMERHDPLDDIDQPTLAERIEPYRRFGDGELAMALLRFADAYGGAGIAAPANHGADYYCPECEINVRGISKPGGPVIACPSCGEPPGMLTLGQGAR